MNTVQTHQPYLFEDRYVFNDHFVSAEHYISSDSALQAAADIWKLSSVLGIDTEFIRVDTFHPRPALIQVSDGKQCWLVDVPAISNFSPLLDVIAAPDIIKIVHAAGEDLEVFQNLLGTLPQPLFDTQIAAALCGHGHSIGYSRLVQGVLNVELSKDQCRSDWLSRPLSAEQKHYACLDVLYLPTLHERLGADLQRLQRLHWADEENSRQIARFLEQRDANYSMEKINNAWRLGEDERKRLWNLILGRDALAREHNKPRNHIAKDFSLFEMAKRPPKHITELSGMDGLRPSGIRQFGHHLIQLAQDVPAQLIYPALSNPLGKAETEHVKKLRALAETIAANYDLPPEILVRKSDLEQLVRQYFLHKNPSGIIMPERLIGWRHAVIGQPLHDEMLSWN